MNTDAPRSITLFSLLFWAYIAAGLVTDIYFWDDTLFEILDGEVAGPEDAFWAQALLAGGLAVVYAILILSWFFVAEKRSRIAKWFYVLLVGLLALGTVLGIEEYTTDEAIMYGLSAMLFVASACFLFTPEARHWFAGKMQIDPSVFE